MNFSSKKWDSELNKAERFAARKARRITMSRGKTTLQNRLFTMQASAQRAKCSRFYPLARPNFTLQSAA